MEGCGNEKNQSPAQANLCTTVATGFGITSSPVSAAMAAMIGLVGTSALGARGMGLNLVPGTGLLAATVPGVFAVRGIFRAQAGFPVRRSGFLLLPKPAGRLPGSPGWSEA